jgi:hypothetical protein
MPTDNIKKKLWDTLYKLVFITGALLVASYAWFTSGTQVEGPGLTIKTQAYTDIELSTDGTTWYHQLDINIPDDFIFASDVTGDGLAFNRPLTKDTNGYPLTFASAVANFDYLEFDIYFRSAVELSVFLEKNSEVRPAAGILEADLIGTEVTHKSSFGNYSRDLIAGATRVSFIKHNYVDSSFVIGTEPSMVWAPNKSYHMTLSDNVYSANINSSTTQNYNYIQVSGGVETGTARPINLKDNINADFTSKNAFGDFDIAKLNNLIGDYYVAKTKIRVWVEGNDREAVIALKGGLFTLNFGFLGIIKEDNLVVPNVSENLLDNTITGYQSTMEHSIDLGNNWIPYSTDNNPTFLTGDTVWVRTSETESHFASSIKTLNY